MEIEFLINSTIEKDYNDFQKLHLEKLVDINTQLNKHSKHKDYLGWLDPHQWAHAEVIKNINEHALLIQNQADVFIIVGVGGSNQAARSIIEAFNTSERQCEIVYAGHNLSAHYYEQLIDSYKDKSIYINVIAKNFATLEPGIGYRILSDFLNKKYGPSAHERIYITGTLNSHLHQLAKEQKHPFFTFPDDIGGRFSSLCNVGLLPMAVTGIPISEVVAGAKEMQQTLTRDNTLQNKAFQYATMRNHLNLLGYDLEALVYFEPQLSYFGKWWVQLFGETEGKANKGIFPVTFSYPEDLHAMGQYVQQGKKILMETFLTIDAPPSKMVIPENKVDDQFAYLTGKKLTEINLIAQEATVKAHHEEGIPIIKLSIPAITPYTFGQLFYFFEYSCYISAEILGVNPFDQPGVEAYKAHMFAGLGKVT